MAIMAMTTFKFSTVVHHLVAIACVMLVAVHVTETAHELEDGVGRVYYGIVSKWHLSTRRLRSQVSRQLSSPCALQFSSDDDCFPNGERGLRSEHCCSEMCVF